MKKPELLAPVGNLDSLYAAVSAGCDAVYLSGKKFGARNYASNFDNNELIDAIRYCHLYGVKVYVTVNTIIYENEVDIFLDYIDFLHCNNVDAVIMQDIGMIDLIRKTYPNLEIHVSTQVNIHNLSGVNFFSNLGINRVVLARETPIEEIENIKKNSNVELEVFIHGALCISYSGQCLMSSLIGGRSGNRGMCCGSCRLPYDLISNGKKVNYDKYLLSTKDLMVLENIESLIQLGIDSFKIEGRMKRPEYVYIIVNMYRRAIDSYFEHGKVLINDDDIISCKKIFNRGFTSGFIFKEKNIVNEKRPNHIGIQIGNVVSYKNGYCYIKLNDDLSVCDGIRIIGKNDVGLTITKMFVNNKSVLKAFKGDVVSFKSDFVDVSSIVLKTTDFNQLEFVKENIKHNNRKVYIKGIVKLNINKKAYIELDDGINKVSFLGNYVSKALKCSINKDQVIKQINRLGNTVFEFLNLSIEIDDNVFYSVKELNELRRNAILLLEEKRVYTTKYKKCDYDIKLSDFKKVKEFSCLINNINDYNKLDKTKFNYIYIENYDDFKKINDSNVFLKIPRINDKYINISSRVLISGIGSLYNYSNVDSDFSFNVVNSYSVAFLHSLGVNKVCLSYELTFDQIKNIIDAYHKRYNKHPNLEVIIKAYEEVMVSKYNLLEHYNLNNGKLRDRFGNLYDIRVKNGLTYIYNYKERNLEHLDFFRIGVNVLRIHY